MVDGKKKADGKRKTNAITKKLLGMTERPTTAGQERYGDVDVAGTRDATARMLEHGPVSKKSVEEMREWRDRTAGWRGRE